jgi:RNA polymerase sigma factor (sigma-70 family)
VERKYYIRIHNVTFEVSHKDYVDYYKMKRRMKYLHEADKRINVMSYNALDKDYLLGIDIIADENVNVEDEVCNKIMLEKLRACLSLLNNDELYLIYYLFYQQKTEQEVADKFGISQVAIHKKKQRILNKLKRLLN